MTLFTKVVVTGGAGFIGSHLVDYLVSNSIADEIVVIDNLSSGRLDNIAHHLSKGLIKFIQADLKDFNEKWMEAFKGAEVVFHFAANPEVRVSVTEPRIHFNENLVSTFNVLEASRKLNVKVHVFASTSTVYGDAKIFPTPEDYHPLEPISIYGAVKLAAEYLYVTYSKLYGFKSLIVRYANIVGPRITHGVIVDFINKLKKNPRVLEILGDGTQRKSYLYVDDAVEGTIHALKHFLNSSKDYDVFNVGNEDWITVKEIADIIVEEMGLRDVQYIYKFGTTDGRGWPGDVKFMLLDISKLKSIGWKPRYTSREAVKKTVKALLSKEFKR